MMKKITDCAGKELVWKQPAALRMEFELHAADEVCATLNFRSMFGSFATARSGDGCWTFKRAGFFRPTVTVRRCDSETDLTVFHNNTWSGGGTLQLQDGRTIRATTSFWLTRSEFTTESEEPLIRFTPGGFIHTRCGVEILPGALKLEELPWLVCLGAYLAILLRRDTSGAAAAAAG